MFSDLMLPILVCAGCLIIIVLVLIKTRKKPPPKTFSIPGTQATRPSQNGETETAVTEAASDQGLLSWHEGFESTVLDFIEFSDGLIETIVNEAPLEEMQSIDVFGATETLELQKAASEHPSPEMGAELSAILAAVSATLHAYLRSEFDLAEQQQSFYQEYREMWFQRLRQFPQDIDRIIRLRRA